MPGLAAGLIYGNYPEYWPALAYLGSLSEIRSIYLSGDSYANDALWRMSPQVVWGFSPIVAKEIGHSSPCLPTLIKTPSPSHNGVLRNSRPGMLQRRPAITWQVRSTQSDVRTIRKIIRPNVRVRRGMSLELGPRGVVGKGGTVEFGRYQGPAALSAADSLDDEDYASGCSRDFNSNRRFCALDLSFSSETKQWLTTYPFTLTRRYDTANMHFGRGVWFPPCFYDLLRLVINDLHTPPIYLAPRCIHVLFPNWCAILQIAPTTTFHCSSLNSSVGVHSWKARRICYIALISTLRSSSVGFYAGGVIGRRVTHGPKRPIAGVCRGATAVLNTTSPIRRDVRHRRNGYGVGSRNISDFGTGKFGRLTSGVGGKTRTKYMTCWCRRAQFSSCVGESKRRRDFKPGRCNSLVDLRVLRRNIMGSQHRNLAEIRYGVRYIHIADGMGDLSLRAHRIRGLIKAAKLLGGASRRFRPTPIFYAGSRLSSTYAELRMALTRYRRFGACSWHLSSSVCEFRSYYHIRPTISRLHMGIHFQRFLF